MNGKVGFEPAERTVCNIIESYLAEAEFLEEVAKYTEHGAKLAIKGNYPALHDCLKERGERIKAIARIEAARKELEKGFGNQVHEDIKEAMKQASIAHERAILADKKLHAVLAGLRTELEKKIETVRHGKSAVNAYDSFYIPNSIAMFLDRER